MLKRNIFGIILVLLAVFCFLSSYYRILNEWRHPFVKVRGQKVSQPRKPFRALVTNNKMTHGYEKGPRWDPGFWNKHYMGWYPVYVVADVFISCVDSQRPEVVVMSRRYRRTPLLNHSTLVIEIIEEGRAQNFRLSPGTWENNGFYESVAIGRYALPLHASRSAAAVCLSGGSSGSSGSGGGGGGGGDLLPVNMRLFYNGSTDYSAYYYEDKKDDPPDFFYHGPAMAYFNVTRSPEPPRSDFAMVGIFSFSRYLLLVWMDYWRALGVDTFYLFYNGPPEHVPLLQRELESFEGSVVLIDWQVIHWLTVDPEDITHGQPIAINTALQRWRHLHKYIAMYDTDEFLVTPSHSSLVDFVEDYRDRKGPFLALRSMCSWAMLTNLSDYNLTSVAQVRLPHLAMLPLERGPPGGREKYFLNVSALEAFNVRYVNMHGIYSHQGVSAGMIEILAPSGSVPGYHLHVLNKDSADLSQIHDSREIFMPQKGEEIKDHHLRDLLQRAIRRRLEKKATKTA